MILFDYWSSHVMGGVSFAKVKPSFRGTAPTSPLRLVYWEEPAVLERVTNPHSCLSSTIDDEVVCQAAESVRQNRTS